MDESRSIEFGLSLLDKIKCIQQSKHVLLLNFKNLKNVIFKKMPKNLLNQNFKCLVFLKLDRPVYYHRLLNLINTTL